MFDDAGAEPGGETPPPDAHARSTAANDGPADASLPPTHRWHAYATAGSREQRDDHGTSPLSRLDRARRRAALRLDGVHARRLAQVAGGVPLAEVLAGVDRAGIGEAALVEAIAASERLVAWAQALQMGLLQELVARRGGGRTPVDGHDSRAPRVAASEVGARLGITPRAARARVDLADALADVPEVADALATGHVDNRKATVLSACPPGLTGRQHREVVRALLPGADRMTAPRLRKSMERAAIRLAPDVAEKRHEAAFADRCVSLESAGDGMAWITAFLRADDALRVRHRLDALADATRAVASQTEDDRSLDQIRADSFVELVAGTHTSRAGRHGTTPEGAPRPFSRAVPGGADHVVQPERGQPRRRGSRGENAVQVTIGAGSLLGLDEEPAELAGYGPIPVSLARELAGDATWRGLFTDATGDIQAIGTRAYRPGAPLARAVTARDARCTFPGCGMPARYTDLDHITPYDAAAATRREQTTFTNLHPLCRGHHLLKTEGHWTVVRTPEGELIWTARATGHTYNCRPERPPGAGSAPHPRPHPGPGQGDDPPY